MWGHHTQPQWNTGFPGRSSLFDGNREEGGLQRYSQRSLGPQGYGYSPIRPQHTSYPGIQMPLFRELGFRLGLHDVPVACGSVMSFVMEPGEGEGDDVYPCQHADADERQLVHGEGHGREHSYRSNERPDEYGHQDARVHGYAARFEGQHSMDYGGRGVGRGFESEPEPEPEGMEECVDGHDSEAVDEEEHGGGLRHGRRKKPRKPRRPYTVTCALRQTNWFESSMDWEDEHFRVIYRVSKATFWGIVDILKTNPIFQSRGPKPQRPVHYQLGVFLMRYGISGSHARHPKLLTSIGEGSVVNYCHRVIRAIREHGLECVVWPSDERKVEIKRGFKKVCGLDGIIGVVDGTLCGLETKPRISGDSYISRKKTLSVNVQAMVDHTGKFIAFQSGWAGSRPDCSVWPNTWVYEHRDELFAPGEFLLADGGYPASPYVLIPFPSNELNPDRRRKKNFNYRISKARIIVEWVFGRLKARFPALRKMGAVRDMDDIYRAIEAMMIIHNVCQDLGDVPHGVATESNEDESSEDEGVNPGGDWDDEERVEEEYPNILTAGRAFRLRCLDVVCPL